MTRITSANVSNVMIGVGLVARGIGTKLFLSSSSSGAAPKPASTRLPSLIGREVGRTSLGDVG